jgi:hypothetical protein
MVSLSREKLLNLAFRVYVDLKKAPEDMATYEQESPVTPLAKPVQKITSFLTEGYYGAEYLKLSLLFRNLYTNSARYIPDVEDPLGVAVTEAVKHGPFFLALRDIWTCIRMFTLFPGVITPFWTTNEQDEFYLWGPNLWGLFLLSLASGLEFIVIFAVVPMFLLLPGPIACLFFTLGQATIHLICLPMQGPEQVQSKTPTDPDVIAKFERNKGERWFFLNGCCVSGRNLQHNVDVLAETFGRPVFAIHNRTYGVLGDLFECILQRSFDLFTEETRVCYEYIKSYISDPNVKKVVLIAHSQGCIMASQILDQLYVDLPAEAVSKLEVRNSLHRSYMAVLILNRSTHLATLQLTLIILFGSFQARQNPLMLGM